MDLPRSAIDDDYDFGLQRNHVMAFSLIEVENMRLIRFGSAGHERPGIWQDDGIVDLRAVFPDIPDINERFFIDGWIEKVAGLESADGPCT